MCFCTALFFSKKNYAQQIFAEAGINTTKFLYTNSNGESLDNLYGETNFNFNIGYRMTLSKVFYLTGSILYNRYGAYGSDVVYTNYYAWDAKYLGFGIGLDIEPYRINNFSFIARLAAEPQFLIGGTQQINEQVFDLKGVEQFDRPFLFAKAGVGINYCADSNIAVSLKYLYGRGFPLGTNKDTESLKIATNTISIGLTISLKNCKYCHPSHFN